MEQEISNSLKQAQEQRSRITRHAKQISIALIATGLLALDWWLLKDSLFGGRPASFWLWPALVTAVWIAMQSFYALANPDRTSFFTFNALGFIAFLLLMPRDIYIFTGGLVFFLLNLHFQRQIQEEEKNQLNFSIRRTLGNSQIIITYALLIVIGFMVYSSVNQDFRRDPDAFYQNLGEAAVRGVPYLSSDSSRFNLSQTLGEFYRRQAQDQFPQFNEVSAQQQRILMEQISQQFRSQFGVDADEDSSLRTVMAQIVTERIREAMGRFERFFPLVFTVLVVALLRTIAFIFNWIVLFITWLFYKLLVKLKFFRLYKEMVEVEKLDI